MTFARCASELRRSAQRPNFVKLCLTKRDIQMPRSIELAGSEHCRKSRRDGNSIAMGQGKKVEAARSTSVSKTTANGNIF